jgi:hypothetical protein
MEMTQILAFWNMSGSSQLKRRGGGGIGSIERVGGGGGGGGTTQFHGVLLLQPLPVQSNETIMQIISKMWLVILHLLSRSLVTRQPVTQAAARHHQRHARLRTLIN